MNADARTTDTDKLWARCKEQDDGQAREELIVHYLPLVKQVAGRLAMGLPSHVDIDDLEGQGMLGLIDAVDKFDPLRGVKFETYGVMRIRGAMLDGLRKADWVPHSLRARSRELEDASFRLETELGRPATDVELAGELRLNVDELNSLLSDLSYMSLTSLENSLTGFDENGAPLLLKHRIADDAAKDPLESLQWEESKELLAAAIDRLPEKERLVISLYYHEGLLAKEIAEIMDLSASRISQLHTKAVMRMRGRLGRHKAILVNW